MNKDIIYIDTEDDITAIIGKIKSSKERIVALVPPKRTGVLQSAVNLRLLSRSAKTSDKQIVLITNNKALVALSATAKIPVAKNLQSKPEIAEIAALEIDDGEDIIDGSQLPIGELAKTADTNTSDDLATDISSIDVDNEGPKNVSMTPNNTKSQPINKSAKNNVKIPNFSKFRKKLFIGIAAGILLVIFLIWAIWFAPSAKIIITANTEPAPISTTVKLGGTSPTDVSKNVVQTVSKQTKKDASVGFTATGQKDMGVKASGSITIRNCDYSDGITLPAGTQFTNDSNQVYVNTAAVFVPKYSGLPSFCTLSGAMSGKATVQVQASSSGETYNNAGLAYAISSIPSSAKVDALGTAMAGGTTRMVTIVTADDVQKASQVLVSQSTDDIKQQLTKQFTNGEVVISDSFTVDRAAAVSTPAIGAEATGKANLTSATTYSITAIAKSELDVFLNAAINKQIDKTQRIYNNGIDDVKLTGYLATDSGATVNIATTGQIGPNIDKESIKTQSKGKRYGDIQSSLESIKGVDSVDVKFSYFWVRTVPNDVDKIQVEFVISNA